MQGVHWVKVHLVTQAAVAAAAERGYPKRWHALNCGADALAALGVTVRTDDPGRIAIYNWRFHRARMHTEVFASGIPDRPVAKTNSNITRHYSKKKTNRTQYTSLARSALMRTRRANIKLRNGNARKAAHDATGVSHVCNTAAASAKTLPRPQIAVEEASGGAPNATSGVTD